LTAAGNPAFDDAADLPASGRRRLPLSWLGVVPFFAYTGIFLLLPTTIIFAGSLVAPDGSISLSNFEGIAKPYMFKSFVNSIEISAVSALVGAIVGALLAYAVASGNPHGWLRRVVMAASGVFAQFGGVTLTFAVLATLYTTGIVYVFLQGHGVEIYPGGNIWLTALPGLTLIYLYFQIPLMVLVFIPAVDGIRPQWREATESLGGGTWHYWRYVAGPLLLPSFLGCTLLLFANAFSAYATAAALLTQGGVLLSLQVQALLTSETGSSQPGLAKALAFSMIVVVLVVMSLYTLLQRRTAAWLR
jgi:putative spermidine/putrescine transport system permease protein